MILFTESKNFNTLFYYVVLNLKMY